MTEIETKRKEYDGKPLKKKVKQEETEEDEEKEGTEEAE